MKKYFFLNIKIIHAIINFYIPLTKLKTKIHTQYLLLRFFYRKIKMFLFKTIKDFNISLDHQINKQMQPRLDAFIQMRLIALFNKYWSGNLEIHKFTKLWIRLIGPLEIIKGYKFYRYFSKEDVDFIEFLIKHFSKPTIH